MFPSAPEAVRAAMAAPIKQAIELNTRLVEAQRRQVEIVKGQVDAVYATNQAAYDATIGMIEASQQAMLAWVEPESDAADS